MMHCTHKHTTGAAHGFTLIEIVITIVILGAVAGILVPFFNAIVHSPDPVIRERAISLGQAMIDEIMAKRWDENTPMGGGPIITTLESPDPGPTCVTTPCSCTDRLSRYACNNPSYTLGISATPTLTPVVTNFGPDGTESRPDYDDVDDYNNLNETNTFTDQNGKTTILTGYHRKVAVSYIPSSSLTITHDLPVGSLVDKTDTKRVVVTITSPLGEVFYFVAVACNI